MRPTSFAEVHAAPPPPRPHPAVAYAASTAAGLPGGPRLWLLAHAHRRARATIPPAQHPTPATVGRPDARAWPASFACQTFSAISALRDGSNVVRNLSQLKSSLEEQQRCVDFVAGGCHALDGHQECLSEEVFLFAPAGVRIASAHSKDTFALPSELATNGLSSSSAHFGS
eukprot:SM000281S10741  [mRNA]  locus=s281:74458:75386:+ [translate_table: standard]